eukprot:SAG11_NODE_13768_length_640_cov_1.393715_1_plen_97_part_01
MYPGTEVQYVYVDRLNLTKFTEKYPKFTLDAYFKLGEQSLISIDVTATFSTLFGSGVRIITLRALARAPAAAAAGDTESTAMGSSGAPGARSGGLAG